MSRGAISGPNGGWARVEEELSYGGHKLTWAYLKDGDTDVGRDTGWADLVSFTGYAGWAMNAGVGQRTNVVFDHDGDGQNMLFEFATGGSATGWDPMPGPSLVGGSLEWRINKPESALLAYDVEVSGDLRAWNQAERDRKSTRLNSSHVVISYAVFCLKKKTRKKKKKKTSKHVQS